MSGDGRTEIKLAFHGMFWNIFSLFSEWIQTSLSIPVSHVSFGKLNIRRTNIWNIVLCVYCP